MPIIARAGSGTQYPPAPAGTHAAICVDVVDLGILEVTYSGKTKKQHKITIVWQIDEDRDDGKPHAVRKRYTLSLHEKAGLRKDLESWRGLPFTQEELDGFDVEVLVGKGCLLNIIHNVKDSNTYANVATIMKLPKMMEAPKARDYVRVCDRTPEDVSQAPPEVGYEYSGGITDDDVPF